jgi:hypothetical protein
MPLSKNTQQSKRAWKANTKTEDELIFDAWGVEKPGCLLGEWHWISCTPHEAGGIHIVWKDDETGVLCDHYITRPKSEIEF